jgi:hypothetical protein
MMQLRKITRFEHREGDPTRLGIPESVEVADLADFEEPVT